MLTPQQTAIFCRQRDDIIGNAFHQHFLLRVAHIQSRPDVQHASIHVAEHAVTQTMAVEQRAKLGNIVSQMLRRNAGILGERNWLRGTFCIAQQTDSLFAHGVNSFDARQFGT